MKLYSNGVSWMPENHPALTYPLLPGGCFSAMTSSGPSSLERIGSHSHIIGLDSIIAQKDAKRAANILVNFIKNSLSSTCSFPMVVITGPPGTGKTALALGIARALGENIPFNIISGCEIYSRNISKSEMLLQYMRQSILLEIKEEVEVIHGEVVEIRIERNIGDHKRKALLTLRTTDMEATYDLGEKIIDSLERSKIQTGDIIKIYKSRGKIIKEGKNLTKARDLDIIDSFNSPLVMCPEGELQKTIQDVQQVTLHEIDLINNNKTLKNFDGSFRIFESDQTEIRPEVRMQVNAKIQEWEEENKAKIIPGILFIDETIRLDQEAFSFISRTQENHIAPLIIMASNSIKQVPLENDCYDSLIGMPMDLLDRSLIISTQIYDKNSIKEIIRLRMIKEDINISEDGICLLADIGHSHSLRYALLLSTISFIISIKEEGNKKGEKTVLSCHIERAYNLFYDIRRNC